eukprot:5455176-Prymnesium_polylepis.1
MRVPRACAWAGPKPPQWVSPDRNRRVGAARSSSRGSHASDFPRRTAHNTSRAPRLPDCLRRSAVGGQAVGTCHVSLPPAWASRPPTL